MEIQSKYDVIIVGGGVYGLSIAYYLSKKQDLKIALLQQYAIGHSKGSSHSTTRITRSLYARQVYRDMNLQCLQKNWHELEKTLGEKLIYENQFVYFDNDEITYNNFRKVAQNSSSSKVKICKNQQQYEQYTKHRKAPHIKSKYPPIIDNQAGVILASVYLKKLYQYLNTKCENVSIIQHTTVKSLNQNEMEINVETQTQILRANKVILACGMWIKQLVPELADLFTVVKQYVAFLQLENMEHYQVGKWPSFAYQQKIGKFYYSVPDDTTDKLGVKLSQHRSIEPENNKSSQKMYEQAYEDLRKKALQYFGEQLVRIKTINECIYTNTKTDDFIIDWTGQSQKILVCSCCSGHGFKFAPIIGEIISDLISPSSSTQQQKTSKQHRQISDAYKKWQHMFKIPYHRGINLE